MTRPLEDQIRNYTEALYATASPVEDLVADFGTGDVADDLGVQITVTAHPRPPRRRWRGPAIAAAAAVAVLVVLLPVVLFFMNGDDASPVEPSTTTTMPVTTTVAPAPGNVFLGSWIGEDPDGSVNLLVVGETTVTYEETGLTACLATFDEFVGGSATGIPEVAGNRLTFDATLFCSLRAGPTAHPDFTNYEWVVDYLPETDTIRLGDDPNAVLRRVE